MCIGYLEKCLNSEGICCCIWVLMSVFIATLQVVDMSVSSQLVSTLVATLPSASQMFQLIQSQSAPASAGFSSQHAVETSVHPLLSLVQQVIPPLHDYSPPMPLSHATYPSHASPQPSHQPLQPSHQALQSSHHAVDYSASSGVQQAGVPLLLTRTSSSSTRGAKSAPPTPKVIIVSGTGISTATTIAGPPPPVVTTTVATKPPPGHLFHFSLCRMQRYTDKDTGWLLVADK